MTKLSVRGFTLIELVIVTVLVGIMATALVPLATSSLRAYRSTVDDVAVLDKLRYTTERLSREIRSIQYASNTDTDHPTACADASTNRYCITTMNAGSLAFRMCKTFDFTTVPTSCTAYRNVTIGTSATASATCVTPSCVTLSYSDLAGGAAQVLTDQLSTLSFTYLQNDGATPATLLGNTNCLASGTCVSYIEINVTLRHNGNDYAQRTRVGLRIPPV